MLKTGTVSLDTGRVSYDVIWYSDDASNERIDVIGNIEDYQMLNTDNCAASYIKSKDERYWGDTDIIHKIISTKYTASMLCVPEERTVNVEDGKFIMEIKKSDPDIGVSYKIVMVNGRIKEEYYEADNNVFQILDVEDHIYIANDRPINWEFYDVLNTIQTSRTGETVKTDQAEFYSYEELLRKYPEVSHVLNNDYKVIRSMEEAIERLNIWINSKEQLKTYDIESYSTDWGIDSMNRITGIFLGFGETWSTYFPFRQQNFKYNLPLSFMETIFRAINEQPEYPTVIMLGHNIKFEIQGFYQEYREVLDSPYIRCDVDTYLLSVLINPVIRKGSHTLKNLTAQVDNNFYLTLEMIFIGPVMFNVLPEEIVLLYGCPDATSPAKLYKYLMQKLPKDEMYVLQLENLLPVIKAMNEFYGIRMDQEKLAKLITNEEYKVQLLGDMFRKIHRTSRNINSSDVLSEILYDKLRCKVEVTTDKGKPATSKFAIDRIISTGKKEITEDTPIPKDILDKDGKVIITGKDLAANKYPSLIIYQSYKKCCKELGALKRLRDHSVNGFFKFYINQVGAGSNRQTSDAHQFSDTMKECVLADSPHHQLVSCDWKQVELRILAGLAQQTDLMKLEEDAGVDIHRAILSIIQKKPMYMISEEDRKAGKSVNFGVVYMMTEYGLAMRDYGPGYTSEQLNDEKKKISDFFNGLPRVKALLHENEEFLKKHGFIKTAFKYYRYFPELLDPTLDSKKAKSYVRSGNNTPVQGTGAGMLKISETKVWRYIREHGWDKLKNYDGKMLPIARMILPIHDEILFSYDKELITMEEIIDMFKQCMELDIDGMPPFFAAPAFINNWYDGKNPNFEVDIPLRDKIIEEYHKGNYMLTGHNYLDVLTEYRENEIREYMEDLIGKYKTVDEVAAHVTHDSLTHTLIETMISDKKERKKLTHVERIHEATKRYMERLENNGKLEEIKNRIYDEEDIEDKSEFIELDDWSLNYSHIDANGDLIEEEVEEDDKDYWVYNEDDLNIDFSIELPHVMYLMNECLIDLTGLDIGTSAEMVNQEIQKLTRPDAYYSVVYVIGNKTIRTNFKVDYIQKELEAVFAKVLHEEVEVV